MSARKTGYITKLYLCEENFWEIALRNAPGLRKMLVINAVNVTMRPTRRNYLPFALFLLSFWPTAARSVTTMSTKPYSLAWSADMK